MSAIDKFRSAAIEELKASGLMPVVAVVGKHDYEELCAELKMLFGATMVPCAEKINQFDGIQVFSTSFSTRGFSFGCIDPILVEP